MARLVWIASLGLAVSLCASVAGAQSAPDAPPASRAVERASEGPTLLWPASPPTDTIDHPILLRGHDMGLISVGIAGLSLGMVIGVIIASLDVTIGNCSSFGGVPSTHLECGTAPFAFVPIAGPVIVGNAAFHGSTSIATILPGTLAAAPEILGLIFLLIGVHGYTEDLVGDVRVSLEPIVGSSQVGAALTVSL